jgi:hypothetical protein
MYCWCGPARSVNGTRDGIVRLKGSIVAIRRTNELVDPRNALVVFDGRASFHRGDGEPAGGDLPVHVRPRRGRVGDPVDGRTEPLGLPAASLRNSRTIFHGLPTRLMSSPLIMD